MPDLALLPHQLDRKQATCRAVIETPRGRRNKFRYDRESGVLELGSVLPEGMSFPYDFGFIPSTLGEDGDPLDVLVLGDEPSFPGCLVPVRLIGVLEAEQTEGGKSERNDRLLAVSLPSHRYRELSHVDELSPSDTEQLEQFFVNYNAVRGKTFRVLALRGPKHAVKLVRRQTVSGPDGAG